MLGWAGHVDVRLHTLSQIACSCKAALAISKDLVYFRGFLFHQHVLCLFVESLSTEAQYIAAISACSYGLNNACRGCPV